MKQALQQETQPCNTQLDLPGAKTTDLCGKKADASKAKAALAQLAATAAGAAERALHEATNKQAEENKRKEGARTRAGAATKDTKPAEGTQTDDEACVQGHAEYDAATGKTTCVHAQRETRSTAQRLGTLASAALAFALAQHTRTPH
ncbi:hypothetical protein ERJ75_001755300 [Trypanosoma vivax]|nr:hypothetical protein ERJ75_001755300 [Trypanosoma vivax]